MGGVLKKIDPFNYIPKTYRRQARKICAECPLWDTCPVLSQIPPKNIPSLEDFKQCRKEAEAVKDD